MLPEGASTRVISALVTSLIFLYHVFATVDFTAALKCAQQPALLLEYYRAADVIAIAKEMVCMFAMFHCAMAEMTGNYSQVDKAWSILPGVYAWHFTIHDYLNRSSFHPRLLLCSILITIWGTRLTYNFARKGGYAWQGRDYRFVYIQEKIGQLGMSVFNVIFIGPMQNVLLLLMTAPLWSTLEMQDTELNIMDLVATLLFLGFLLTEVIADDQQFMFQTKKHALLQFVGQEQLSGDYKKGFLCSSGLWQYSRHPNFFSEISLWWCIYLFSVAANMQQQRCTINPSPIPANIQHQRCSSVLSQFSSSVWMNWAMAGPVLLTLLFQGSTWLTERISSTKYPEYAEYQKTVRRFIPWFPGRPHAEHSKNN